MSKHIDEVIKRVDEKFEGMFNLAVNHCLEQIRGEITGEERKAKLKVLDTDGLQLLTQELKALEETVRREMIDSFEKYLKSDALTHGVSVKEFITTVQPIEEKYLKQESQEKEYYCIQEEGMAACSKECNHGKEQE